MRGFALSLALAVAGMASASFDLVLITDSTNGLVHRIDGDSGTYLGSFGGGILADPRAIAIDQANNIAYVGDTSVGMVAMNYNTGQVLWSNPAFSNYGDLAYSNGFLLRNFSTSSLNAISRFSASPTATGTLLYTASSLALFRGVGVDAAGDYLSVDTTFGRVVRHNPGSSSLVNAIGSTGSFTGVSGVAVSGSTLISMTATGTVITAPNTQALGTASIAGSALASPWVSAADIAFGHQNFAWGVGRTSTVTRLQRYARNPITGAYNPAGGGYSLSMIGNPTGVAVVVAPEPGTMLALGAGVAALLRRRRKSV